MENPTQVKCPKCGTLVNVESIIAHRIEENLKNEFNQKYLDLKTVMEGEVKQKEITLQKQQEELTKNTAAFETKVNEKVALEAAKQQKQLQEKIYGEFEIQLKSATAENADNKKRIDELSKAAIENESLKRKLDEQEREMEMRYEKKMTEALRQKTEDIARLEAERNEMRFKEKDELIKNLNDQMNDMKRRIEQGSMQLQGEVQELALEELLRELFVTDLIEEVGKGVKGADVIHSVRDRFGKECGKILYESKRTKHFNHDWITKLKHDSVLVKADLLVIVSETLPEGMDKLDLVEGVWICGFYDVKMLAIILRESLIKINQAYTAQANKGDKMQMLYDYLTSTEFILQFRAITEGFVSLKESYEKEKNAMQRIWKEREKQLDRILLNTNEFIGSIQGIAGSSIPDLNQIGGDNSLLLE